MALGCRLLPWLLCAAPTGPGADALKRQGPRTYPYNVWVERYISKHIEKYACLYICCISCTYMYIRAYIHKYIHISVVLCYADRPASRDAGAR